RHTRSRASRTGGTGTAGGPRSSCTRWSRTMGLRSASSGSSEAGRRRAAAGRTRMAEGDMEWAVHEALAAVGLSVALVDGQEPFRVRWANAAFARELGAVGAAIEGQP